MVKVAFQIFVFEAAMGQEKHFPKLQTSVSYAKLPTTFVGGVSYGKFRIKIHLRTLFGRHGPTGTIT